jgi:ATP-dependent Zn protease
LAEQVMENQGLSESVMNDHSVTTEDQNRVAQTMQQAQVIPAYQISQESCDQQQLHNLNLLTQKGANGSFFKSVLAPWSPFIIFLTFLLLMN